MNVSGTGNQAPAEEHYSYRVYRNPTVAESFDCEKFGGSVGFIFKNHQENVVRHHFPDVSSRQILDLGAGTGRLALPMSRWGATVFAADFSFPMLSVAKEKSWLQGCDVRCVRVDAHNLPFPDQFFWGATCMRLLMHVVNWEQVIQELCRVTQNTLIFDFPPKCGFAGLAPVVHPLIRLVKKDHQSYRVFKIKDFSSVLEQNGFQIYGFDRHLVLPFGLHRLIGSPLFSKTVEGLLKKIGLSDIFAAPVTIIAKRI